MQLNRIDMNLLVVLDALLDTSNVSAAAARLALSPSATSHALSRLRAMLGDPILVRAGRAMAPSARAERMRPRLRELLHGICSVLEPDEEVEPLTLRRSFKFAATDYAEVTVVQPLSDRLCAEAPGVDLYSFQAGKDSAALLRDGDYDVALGVFSGLSPDLQRQTLLHEDFVCLLRRGHPVLQRPALDLETYCALGHVLTAPRGVPRGAVDEVLAAEGRSRRIARTVTSFLAAPHLVARTDYVLTAPKRIAERVAHELDLAHREPPVELRGFDHEMIWHRRDDHDPAHRWIRGEIAEVARRPEA
jgi:DNA-binding transcriptional LysR family regulator